MVQHGFAGGNEGLGGSGNNDVGSSRWRTIGWIGSESSRFVTEYRLTAQDLTSSGRNNHLLKNVVTMFYVLLPFCFKRLLDTMFWWQYWC